MPPKRKAAAAAGAIESTDSEPVVIESNKRAKKNATKVADVSEESSTAKSATIEHCKSWYVYY
jgi:hypothetical protein